MHNGVNKDNVLFITAVKGFYHDGIASEGYKIFSPYKEHNIFDRIIREMCFRTPFLPSRQWYNKNIYNEHPDYVIVSDPLITVDYLNWLQKTFPNAQLNFTYGNMVGKARHIKPYEIPKGWRIWTYDDYDAKEYGLRLYRVNAFFRTFLRPRESAIYDVLFVGKDKGRGDYLLKLEERFKSMGLRTKFIIAADGRLNRRKKYYQKPIPYKEVVDLIVKSRSILNVAMEDQKGMTLRDLESLFFDVKLLTTNKNVVNMDFYNPKNVFILDGLNNIEDIPAFLSTDSVLVPDEIKKQHTLEHFVDYITECE